MTTENTTETEFVVGSRCGIPPVEVLQAWADLINDWYDVEATVEDMLLAYGEAEQRDAVNDLEETVPYVDLFLKNSDGRWTMGLDTSDRETFADFAEARHIQRAN